MADMKKVLNDDEVENINGGVKSKVIVINDEDDLLRAPVVLPSLKGKDDPGENPIFKSTKKKS